ncbi:MAG: hypothetical protein M5U10_13465 [Candidatus Methanoperedens sp.]|nr:hypothetical protein [Candidatus Methanoperedens nitroreducens]MDJ1422911.1 hypothetical protein [Candidatus Methanoperedens sp.]
MVHGIGTDGVKPAAGAGRREVRSGRGASAEEELRMRRDEESDD